MLQTMDCTSLPRAIKGVSLLIWMVCGVLRWKLIQESEMGLVIRF